ncbi:hypothetical protein [Neomegalonema perideroedes]|uniref:hypothetical protein n=1 Tax=Neomegalonema perideroedes TaxID=217219 RepID=UPI0012FD1C65|nr:hypothetical protein [Neomegalonema perideroedes]
MDPRAAAQWGAGGFAQARPAMVWVPAAQTGGAPWIDARSGAPADESSGEGEEAQDSASDSEGGSEAEGSERSSQSARLAALREEAYAGGSGNAEAASDSEESSEEAPAESSRAASEDRSSESPEGGSGSAEGQSLKEKIAAWRAEAHAGGSSQSSGS